MNFKKWIINENISKYVNSDGTIDLFHYGHIHPNPKGFAFLDPKKAELNKGFYSKNDYAALSIPRIFFYLNPEDRKHDVAGLGNFLYKVTIPSDWIYDLENDPEDFWGRAEKNIRKELEKSDYPNQYSKPTLTYVVYLIKKNGYKGILYKTNYFDVVVFFARIKAELVDKN